jgi:hypothetical protein
MVSLSVSFSPSYVRGFLTDDFTLQSDSINWILGLPSGAVTFNDPDSLVEGAYNLTTSAPQPPITVSFVCPPGVSFKQRGIAWAGLSIVGG